MDSITGTYFNNGNPTQHCAVFAAGTILMLVNERMDAALARLDQALQIRLQKHLSPAPNSWSLDVSGDPELDPQSKQVVRIKWSNGSAWLRARKSEGD
jgi:hypothetical protein